jgi:dynein heavy chain 1
MIDTIAMENFPTVNKDDALCRPILFSNWLSKHYVTVDREQLREFTKARLKVFCEEELDVVRVLHAMFFDLSTVYPFYAQC